MEKMRTHMKNAYNLIVVAYPWFSLAERTGVVDTSDRDWPRKKVVDCLKVEENISY